MVWNISYTYEFPCTAEVTNPTDQLKLNIGDDATFQSTVNIVGDFSVDYHTIWQVSKDNGLTFEDIIGTEDTTVLTFPVTAKDNGYLYRMALHLVNAVSQKKDLFTEAATLEVLPQVYNLSFNLNGGTGTIPTTQSLVEGATGIAVDKPSRENYTFLEWNTKQDGSGSKWEPGITPMIANDVTLFAQWQENKTPVPPTPEPKPDNNGTGQLSQGLLPKTGGV